MAAYDASLRVWRGDDDGGELKDYTVEVNDGEVVLDIIHRLQATQTPRSRRALELQGRQVRIVLGGDQRPAAAAVHDADVDVRRGRDRHGDAAAHLPRDARPGHRRVLQLQKAREIPSFTPPKDLQPGEYRMQQEDVNRSQEFRKCIECFLCQNVCHVVRDHEENKESVRRSAVPDAHGRAVDMHPLDIVDRRTWPRRRTAWASATSPSAAPRSAPSTSRSPTTR